MTSKYNRRTYSRIDSLEHFKDTLAANDKSMRWFHKNYINRTGLGYRLFCFDLERFGMVKYGSVIDLFIDDVK